MIDQRGVSLRYNIVLLLLFQRTTANLDSILAVLAGDDSRTTHTDRPLRLGYSTKAPGRDRHFEPRDLSTAASLRLAPASMARPSNPAHSSATVEF